MFSTAPVPPSSALTESSQYHSLLSALADVDTEAEQAEAKYKLAKFLQNCKTMKQDHRRARELYEEAVKAHHCNAAYELGKFYRSLYDQTVTAFAKRSVELLELAAKSGVGEAYQKLGLSYENGIGVDQSNDVAQRWVRVQPNPLSRVLNGC